MTIVLSIIFVAAAMLLMAVGVLIRGKSFKASCGGHGAIGPDGDLHNCGRCGCDRDR